MGKRIAYAVPYHRLSGELVERFVEAGVRAEVWRGREAGDPSMPGEKMCRDLEAVREVQAVGLDAEKTVCRATIDGVERRCPFYDVCGYQAQKPLARAADVVIVAHHALFARKPGSLGDIGLLVIDETFWAAGLKVGFLTADELARSPTVYKTVDKPSRADPAKTARVRVVDDWGGAELARYRSKLARLVREMEPGTSPSAEAIEAAGLSVDECDAAAKLEWERKGRAQITPGMDPDERRTALAALADQRGIGTAVTLWKALGDALLNRHTAASVVARDRDTKHGTVRQVEVHYRREIGSEWAAGAVLHLDATMRPELVGRYFPDMAFAERLDASGPHVTVEQIIGAPVSERALTPDGNAAERYHTTARHNRRDITAFIRRQARAHRGMGASGIDVLVIGQMAAVAALAPDLPPNAEAAHFNALAGQDRWGGVACVVVLGRTQPAPATIERTTGAITNRPPEAQCAGWWYDETERAIGLVDGTAHPVRGEIHPDPLCEAVRWSICEAELVQAIGRGRGVNRGADNPLTVYLLADVVLPLAVSRVRQWKAIAPSRLDVMAAAGVELQNAADMARCFPELWSSHAVARTDRARSVTSRYYMNSSNSGMSHSSPEITYRPAGVGQKPRTARFDLAVIPDPRAWLEERVGPLAEFAGIEAANREAVAEVARPSERWVGRGVPPVSAPPALAELRIIGAAPPPCRAIYGPPGRHRAADRSTCRDIDLARMFPPRMDSAPMDPDMRPPMGLKIRAARVEITNPEHSHYGQVVSINLPFDGLLRAAARFGPRRRPPGRPKLAPVPAIDLDAARDRLADLSARLVAVHPPRLWGDGMDDLRILDWRERQARARQKQEAGGGRLAAPATLATA